MESVIREGGFLDELLTLYQVVDVPDHLANDALVLLQEVTAALRDNSSTDAVRRLQLQSLAGRLSDLYPQCRVPMHPDSKPVEDPVDLENEMEVIREKINKAAEEAQREQVRERGQRAG